MAGRVLSVRERLGQVIEQFEKFRFLCRALLRERGLAEDFGGLLPLLKDASRLAEERLIPLREDLNRLYGRLQRDTLNVAVIGRARQGKSRLLQSITGLGPEEIPDGSQAFCTGVRSDIVSDPTVGDAYALVHFLTEEQFIQQTVAPYFEELQKYRTDLLAPLTVADFKAMRLPEPGSLRAELAGGIPSDRATLLNLHLQHLKDLQDHLPQYQGCLGHAPLRVGRERIREYVAQDNADGDRVFFKHRAVDHVEIFCRFPNSDAGGLRLIDLPGLGDTRIGDVERVVRALREQADLALFLSKPSNTGAGWQDNEVHLYSQARRALCEKLPIERWALWVFNHDSRGGADNRSQCELLQKSMSGAQIRVAGSMIVDCANPAEVSSKLIGPALEILSGNIERNDREYAENLQKMLMDAMTELHGLLDRAQRALGEEGDSDRDSGTFDALFDDLWDRLREEIQGCVEEGSELRRNRTQPCKALQDRIESILSEEEARRLEVTAEELKRVSRRKGGLGSAYEEALHQLRTGLSRKMQENLDDILDGVLMEMKDRLCAIMGTAGRLSNHFGGVSDHRLLGEMIRFIRDSGFERDMPTLLEGLCLLEDWKMSYRSFIQHRLRSSLNGLDPLDEECLSMGSPTNENQAMEILQALYQQTIYKLRQAFDDIYSEPNKAAFAVAEEFKDIMIRPHETQQGTASPRLTNQWRQLYRSIRGDVWPDEYGNSQRRRDACAKLRGPLLLLVPLCEASNFDFLE